MLSFSGVSFVLFCFFTVCVLFSFLFLPCFCFFGDVAFSEYFCTVSVFSLYWEDVVRFFLTDGVFLPCDHVLDFSDLLLSIQPLRLTYSFSRVPYTQYGFLCRAACFWSCSCSRKKKNLTKGGFYGNKILYKNLKFFDKIFVRGRFRNALCGEKIFLMGKCFKRKIRAHLDLLSIPRL